MTQATIFCNYADESTLFSLDKNANIVVNRLRFNFAKISEWFYESCMILSPDKCYYLTLGFNELFPDFSFNDTTIENVTEEKILGIVINNKLNFKSRLNNIRKTINQKTSALPRTSKLATLNQQDK